MAKKSKNRSKRKSKSIEPKQRTKVGKFLRTRQFWTILILVAVLFLLFYDRDGFESRAELREEISKLKEQRDYYRNRIAEDSTLIEKLKDNEFLEQYARENYLMKRDSDVVYVLEPEKQPLKQHIQNGE
jgi:cell division protein FtsB